MEIKQNYSLRKHNTFGIDAQADWFISYRSLEDLHLLARDEYFQECRCVTIGEGSNLLFLTNFHGIILFSELKTIELLGEDDSHVDYLVGSGVHWDDFVQQMTDLGLGGIENLSLIPGQVGAAAIQNIGAYGVELSIPSTDALLRSVSSLSMSAPMPTAIVSSRSLATKITSSHTYTSGWTRSPAYS